MPIPLGIIMAARRLAAGGVRGVLGVDSVPRRRRRRRKLLTAGELRDLMAIKEVLGRTAAASAIHLIGRR